MLIEQAIFTSIDSQVRAGYQLVAWTRGLSEADRRALSHWGPSHDSLLDDVAPGPSLNFHPLPSGSYCVARTVAAGAEYSGRRGQQIYTQSLVVPRAVMQQFCNNAFAVDTAAEYEGKWQVLTSPPFQVAPLRLDREPLPLDVLLVRRVVRDQGCDRLALLLSALCTGRPLGLVVGSASRMLLQAALNCVPLSCRLDVSFSTGLKLSPRRPFQVVALPIQRQEQKRLIRQHNLEPLEVAGEESETLREVGSWAALVQGIIRSQDWDVLRELLADAPAGLKLDQVDGWAQSLIAAAQHVSRTGSAPA
jgi:hypothetical protein